MTGAPTPTPDLRSGIGAWTHIVDPLFHATTVPMTQWDDDALVAAAIEWEKAKSIAEAQQLAAMAILAERRVAQAQPMELTRKDGSTYRISLTQAQQQAVSLTAPDFQVPLHQSTGYAKDRINQAIALYDGLPEVWSSLNRGEISAYHARIITEEVECLDAEQATQTAHDLLPAAKGYTPARLRNALRKAVMHADPEAALRRYQQSRKERKVTTRIVEDAMGWFSAFLTAAEMTELMGIIDAYARALPVDDDTLANRRADALVGLVRRGSGLRAEPASQPPKPTTTEPTDAEPTDEDAASTDDPADSDPADSDPFEEQLVAEDGEVVPAGTRLPEGDPFPGISLGLKPNVDVRVIIGAGTLLGLDNEPGFLAGYGLISAEIARELAADGTWRRMLTDAESGAMLDLGNKQYRPSYPLQNFVRERDQTCRFAGCDRRAHNCDIDHVIPWPKGTTCKDNHACLCTWHHKLKTIGGWKLHLAPDGTCTWTSPTGRQTVTRPPKPGGLPPPTEILPAPTFPSRRTLLRMITRPRPKNGSTPNNSTAGEPPF